MHVSAALTRQTVLRVVVMVVETVVVVVAAVAKLLQLRLKMHRMSR